MEGYSDMGTKWTMKLLDGTVVTGGPREIPKRKGREREREREKDQSASKTCLDDIEMASNTYVRRLCHYVCEILLLRTKIPDQMNIISIETLYHVLA